MASWRRWTAGVGDTLEFIKFSHTVFALPFALVAMLTAARGWPPARVVVLILVCMAAARTAAMAFNRLADWESDKLNPRTAHRSRLATRRTAGLLVAGGLVVFVAGAQRLNPLCFALSPAAIALVLGYSLTKRFTAFPHFFLGLALGAAPMGAWAAVRGELWSGAPWVLMAAVLCWVFGFDLIYATLDADFDRRAGVLSFPARYGVPAALKLAAALHAAAWLLFAVFGWIAGFGWPYAFALIVVAAALFQEQRMSRTGDIGKINASFFQVNVIIGVVLLVCVGLNLWIT